jgi:hypothetical protein
MGIVDSVNNYVFMMLSAFVSDLSHIQLSWIIWIVHKTVYFNDFLIFVLNESWKSISFFFLMSIFVPTSNKISAVHSNYYIEKIIIFWKSYTDIFIFIKFQNVDSNSYLILSTSIFLVLDN